MTIKMNTSKFDAWVKDALAIDKELNGFLNRVIFPFLFKGDSSRQAKRWMSKGASEGKVWAPLSPAYAKRKLSLFKSYPGSGTKLLVATSRLLAANTGRPQDPSDLSKVVQNGVLFVRIGVTYAGLVNRKRNFITFGGETYREMKKMLRDYIGERYARV